MKMTETIERLPVNCRAYLRAALMLPLLVAATGCDPCMNNPCNDGLACNGQETCTADGGQAVCADGAAVQCPPGEDCTEPDGACVGPDCTVDSECDDSDACTDDSCLDGACEFTAVVCPEGQECDTSTGECVGNEPEPSATLSGAVGVFEGASTCGDDDNQVTLTESNGTLTLSGLTGNGDIPLSLSGDRTGVASGVVAFGEGGHDMTLTYDPATGEITVMLSSATGSCETVLTPAP